MNFKIKESQITDHQITDKRRRSTDGTVSEEARISTRSQTHFSTLYLMYIYYNIKNILDANTQIQEDHLPLKLLPLLPT